MTKLMMMKMKAMMMVPWLDGAGEEEFFLSKRTRELMECRVTHTQERKKDA